ncbi:MAG: carboxylating nicotinate-nucleotide diphosphorylase [Thermodesulfobacteriota bacterium]|nr:carboxylating nicotinate-nucleotide diphosphorylase [Thermodesulfobacteriota bacterium]
MIEHHHLLERIVRFALEEDLGSGDITTNTIVDSVTMGKAYLLAREKLVLAGLPVFKKVFSLIDPRIELEECFEEGEQVPKGSRICVLTGPLNSILQGERTAINFLQRMSGIATLTRQCVERVRSLGVRVLDTRKTAPGLRLLDKYAVRMGGGLNHRFGLFDGILIKDNHITAAGSITRAVELATKGGPHSLRIEVEVEDLAGAKEAMQAGADTIMLDNMDLRQMRKVVQFLKGRVMIEASGGINLETILDVAGTGVDFVSVGALTHSATAADLSLEILPVL